MAKDIIQFSPHPKTPAAFVVTINGEPITPKDSTMLRRALHQASMQERLLEQLNLQRCAAIDAIVARDGKSQTSCGGSAHDD